jgi:hypothetical protein
LQHRCHQARLAAAGLLHARQQQQQRHPRSSGLRGRHRRCRYLQPQVLQPLLLQLLRSASASLANQPAQQLQLMTQQQQQGLARLLPLLQGCQAN